MTVKQRMPQLIMEPRQRYDSERENYLTASAVKDWVRSPAIYAARRAGELPNRISRALDVGSAAHVLILEGLNEYTRWYVVSSGPINEKTGKPYGSATKAYQEWKDGLDPSLTLITPGDDATVREMAASVRVHPIASEWLSRGVAEGVVRTDIRGLPVQARLDFLSDDGWVTDLKTCRDLDAFGESFDLYGYGTQAAFYQMVFEAAYGYAPPVRFVAVEKQAPYRVGVFEIDDARMSREREDLGYIMESIRQAEATGVYATKYDSVIKIGDADE